MVAKKKATKKAAAPKKAVAKKPVKKAAKKPVVKAAAPAKVSSCWWSNTFTPAGALIAIASFIGIMAMLAPWIGDNVSGFAVAYNGWDLLTVSGSEKEMFLNNSWQTFIPLITFICSIVAFIAIILPAFKLRTNKVATDVLVIVLGLVMFILSICFLFGQIGNEIEGTAKFSEWLFIGFYMTIVPSIVMILAGLYNAIKNAKL